MAMENDLNMISADTKSQDADGSCYDWKILVVDDEKDVHEVTRLAFEDITFEGKTLKLLSAYSESQARQLLKKHDDVALVLLDVVMETDDAGLDLVRHIREELGNSAVQIILRTGYPGHAPERKIIRDYDISDYWEKTDLTAEKLYTLVVSGLRSHKNYMTLQTYSQKLKNEIRQREKAEKEKDKLIGELQQALAKIKTLSGLLPICTICKKIRDDKGVWNQFESYLYRHTEADFSHSVCPQCAKTHYPDYDIYE
jgi:CheY-like chemotaxis protein